MIKHTPSIRLQQPTNCLSVFEHFMGLALKGLNSGFVSTGRITFTQWVANSANKYLFKVENRNTKKRCKICLKLPTETPEQSQWRLSVVFIINFKHISQLFLVFPIVDFTHIFVC